MKEIWKPVLGYEGIYEVSSNGRVKRLEVTVHLPRQTNILKEKMLKGSFDKDGYIVYGLYKNRKAKYCKGHRLVLAAFVCPSDLEVNHKNLDKQDNRLINLEYVTPLINSLHARRKKANWAPTGDSHANTKVTFEEMVEIIFLRMNKTPVKPIAEAYGIREDYIKSLKQRKEYHEAYCQANAIM